MHNLASTIHCLAISYKDEALLSEAESLAFNALVIFSAQEKSGYISEWLNLACQRYRAILLGQGLSPEAIRAKLASLGLQD
jgi:hypothetical protein